MKNFPERGKYRFFRYVLLFLCIVSLFCTAACGAAGSETDHAQGQEENISEQDGESETIRPEQGEGQAQEVKMYLKTGDAVFTATLADNDAARALVKMLPLTLTLRDYGGFEKVGSLGSSLPRSDVSVTTQPGEFVLYQGTQFVLFYGQNTWSYTRLGKIEGITAQQLKEILGEGSVTVTLSMEK